MRPRYNTSHSGGTDASLNNCDNADGDQNADIYMVEGTPSTAPTEKTCPDAYVAVSSSDCPSGDDDIASCGCRCGGAASTRVDDGAAKRSRPSAPSRTSRNAVGP